MLRSIPFRTTLVLSLVLTACSGGAGASADSTSIPATTTDAPNDATSTTEPPSPNVTTEPASTTTTTLIALGGDLVFNGDFDLGDGVPSGWQFTVEVEGQEVEYVTEGADHHVSFFAPSVEEVPWPEARLIQPFQVDPHRDYMVEVEARTLTQGRLFLALVFLDEDGDEILLRGPGEPEISGSEWETIQGTLESPVNAAQAFVVLRLSIRPDLNTADSFSVDVNRVSVREVLD